MREALAAAEAKEKAKKEVEKVAKEAPVKAPLVMGVNGIPLPPPIQKIFS